MSVEVRAPASGVLVEFLAAMDEVVEVGNALFKLDTTATAPASGAPAAPPTAAVPAAAPKAAAPAAPPKAAAPKAAAPKAAAAAPAANGGALFSGSVLSGSSAGYVDAMYACWKADPGSVHASWNAYFSGVDSGIDPAHAFVAPPTLSGHAVPAPGSGRGGAVGGDSGDTARTMHLIAAYQRRGHEMAILDPLGLEKPTPIKDLDPATYGFDMVADWERGLNLQGSMVQAVQGLMGNADVNDDGETTLHELVDFLQSIYCGTVGIEIEGVTDLDRLNWLRSRVEKAPTPYTKDEKRLILERLAFSEQFEEILAKRFGAMKRFGLEGAESMIPGLKVFLFIYFFTHGSSKSAPFGEPVSITSPLFLSVAQFLRVRGALRGPRRYWSTA